MHSTIFSKAILAAIWSSAVAGQREGPSSHHTKRVTPAKGLISGWVTAWGGNVSMPLYEKYDELTYLGALTTSDGGVNMTVDGDPLQKYIFTQANMTAIRPLLSVGGWAGSQFVSYRTLSSGFIRISPLATNISMSSCPSSPEMSEMMQPDRNLQPM